MKRFLSIFVICLAILLMFTLTVGADEAAPDANEPAVEDSAEDTADEGEEGAADDSLGMILVAAIGAVVVILLIVIVVLICKAVKKTKQRRIRDRFASFDLDRTGKRDDRKSVLDPRMYAMKPVGVPQIENGKFETDTFTSSAKKARRGGYYEPKVTRVDGRAPKMTEEPKAYVAPAPVVVEAPVAPVVEHKPVEVAAPIVEAPVAAKEAIAEAPVAAPAVQTASTTVQTYYPIKVAKPVILKTIPPRPLKTRTVLTTAQAAQTKASGSTSRTAKVIASVTLAAIACHALKKIVK